MNPALRFLLILAAVALAVCIAINVMLGPPGLSKGFLEKYKDENEHYLEFTKSEEYKRWQQAPELNGPGQPGVPGNFAANLEFVDHYEGMDEFKAEQERRFWYGQLFDFFNASLVVIIMWRFGRKPLLNFLDAKIAELRERMEAANQERREAEQRKRAAEEQIAALPIEAKRIAEETRERIEREMAALKEANDHSLGLMQQDLADRRGEVIKNAAMKVKKELVNQAVDAIAQGYREKLAAGGHQMAAHQEELIGDFAAGLETRS